MQYQGIVSKVSSFDYMGKQLWSFQLNGTREFYRTGNIKPKIESGQFVTFTAEPGKNNSINVDTKTIQAKDASSEQSGTGVSNALNKGSTTATKDSYWADREARDVLVQKRIERQSCRNSALEFIQILLAHEGAVKIPAKTDKVTFFEEMLAHYTEKFIEDNSGESGTSADKRVDSTETDSSGDYT